MSVEDLCGISVEEIAFGRHFQTLFRRTRAACSMDDQDLYQKVCQFNQRFSDHGELYELFEVESGLRDPGEYDVAVR